MTSVLILVALFLQFFLVTPVLAQQKTEIAFQGKLTIVHKDNFPQRLSGFEYIVEDQKQKYYLLKFIDSAPQNLKSGSQVTVKGAVEGSTMTLSSKDISAESIPKSAIFAAPITGPQNLAVILINFQDYTSQPLSVGQIQNLVFDGSDSVNSYYKENSYNIASLSGTIFNWLTLPIDRASSPNCQDFRLWSNTAKNLLQEQGVSLTNFSRFIYVFPFVDGCNSTGGIGTVVDNPSESWIFTVGNRGYYAHELGHNFGVNHANALLCGNLQINNYSSCTSYEYADLADVMGVSLLHHFNAPYKSMVGWLPESQIINVNSSGNYTISALESNTQSPLALRINKPNTSDFYFVEYRLPIGFDANMPFGLLNGASIRIGDTNNPFKQTQLIDVTVQSKEGLYDAILNDGVVFNDGLNQISIKQLRHDSSSVTLEVQLSPKRVFITSTKYTGNLGGLSGADNKCQGRATSTGLGGTWKAWLSDGVTSVLSRQSQSTGSYRLMNGITVANNWKDLTDGTLTKSININELGSWVPSADGIVWTNTTASGTRASTTSHCSNWTSIEGLGFYGVSGITYSAWTQGRNSNCSNAHRLYCFEQ